MHAVYLVFPSVCFVGLWVILGDTGKKTIASTAPFLTHLGGLPLVALSDHEIMSNKPFLLFFDMLFLAGGTQRLPGT